MRCIISRTRKLPVPAPRSSMPTRTITLAFAAIPASATVCPNPVQYLPYRAEWSVCGICVTAVAPFSALFFFRLMFMFVLCAFPARSNVGWSEDFRNFRRFHLLSDTTGPRCDNIFGISVTKLSICRAYNGRALPTELRAVGSQQMAKTIAEVPRRTNRPGNPMVRRRRSDGR